MSGRYPFRTGVTRNNKQTAIEADDCLIAKGMKQANITTFHVRALTCVHVCVCVCECGCMCECACM